MACDKRTLVRFALPWALALSAAVAKGEEKAQTPAAPAPSVASSVMTLSPQDVVDTVLTKSFDAKQIEFTAQNALIAKEKSKSVFDFQLNAKLSYEYSEAEAISGFSNPQDKTLLGDLNLSKAMHYGSVWTVGYQHQAQSSVLNPILSGSRGPTAVLDSAYLQLRQHLWNDVFGLSDRLAIEVAERNVKESDLQKQESTEALVLQALKTYWDTYVAQTQLNDALEARKKYQALIKVVKHRGRFGLDKGGEYAQVMADYWDSENNVKLSSYQYLSALHELSKLMKTDFSQDLRFAVDKEIPTLPQLPEIQISQLRDVRVHQSQYDTAKMKRRTAGVAVAPTLDLVLKASTTGVDEDAQTAYSRFVAGTHPDYFAGLEFSTPLDSSTARAALAQADLDVDQTELTLNKSKLDNKLELERSQEYVRATFEAAQGAVKAEIFRSKTVAEQEREYRQGRLTLSDLLQTYKNYFNSQSQKVRAIGNYQIALNQLAAIRDELVK